MYRNLATKINALLQMFPVVAIVGARQCGKTTLAKALCPDWQYLDLEKKSDFDRIHRDPEFFFQENPQSIIFDEAQLSPQLFAVLRGVIDQDRQCKGRFILTGSSSPQLLTHIAETLAGRIATVELGTFKANELHNQPLSSFYQLFLNPLSAAFFDNLPSPILTPAQLKQAWYEGGYPEPVLSGIQQFYPQWMENYENTYIYRDIARLYPRLNKVAYQRFLTMLCKLSGTIINKAELARALEVSEGSVREFLNIAEGTFLWRQLPSYENTHIKSVVKMPKGHVRDSGLLHSLLRITNEEQLYNDPIVGRSFEAFITEEIIKGMQSLMITHWRPYYYRTRGGAEIDLILEGPFGVLPIEIKHGITPPPRRLKVLEDFVVENKLPFGLLINQAEKPYWLTRHIFQLPAHYL